VPTAPRPAESPPAVQDLRWIQIADALSWYARATILFFARAELAATRKTRSKPCSKLRGGTTSWLQLDQLRSGRAVLPAGNCAPSRRTQTKILQFEIHIVQICTTAREKVAPTTKAPKRKITSTLPASAKKRGVSENDRHATDGMNRLRLCHTIDEYRYIGRTGSQAKKERGFGWSEKLAALLSSQPPCPPCPAR